MKLPKRKVPPKNRDARVRMVEKKLRALDFNLTKTAATMRMSPTLSPNELTLPGKTEPVWTQIRTWENRKRNDQIIVITSWAKSLGPMGLFWTRPIVTFRIDSLQETTVNLREAMIVLTILEAKRGSRRNQSTLAQIRVLED
jgi:hypothetical protein